MELPAEGYIRVKQIIGCRKLGIPAVIPVSESAWWKGVRSGKYPKGVKLSAGVTVWNVKVIRALIAESEAA